MNFHEAVNYVKRLNLKLDKSGLLPAIIQDKGTGKVLMLAYMSQESLAISLVEERTCYWSRSRKTLWRKGETSQHIQKIISVALDCDRDTLLIQVEQTGAACHTGKRSCFDNYKQIFTSKRRN